jgi:histidinol dehydrogenase
MRTLRIRTRKDLQALERRLRAQAAFSPADERKVASILAGIRRKGDAALLQYARRFDGFKGGADDLRLAPSDIRAAHAKVDPAFRKAIAQAIANIRAYQEKLRPKPWRQHLRPGVLLGQLVRPLQRVGLYVPGGEAPLVSTVLMLAVPARVAGVTQIALCTPSRGGQGVDPRIVVAADMAGVEEIYQVGGAQAIAALAYGTASIPKVAKVLGPGNRFVTLAKRMIFGHTGIDMLAGPSECLVLADDSAPPAWVAADLLSQAEHAGDEAAILVTASEKLAKAVQIELKKQLAALPRRRVAAQSLAKHGLIVLVKDLWAAVEVAELVASEHLQLMVRDAEKLLPKIKSAGAIFVGPYTPVALGDFLAGPSHVLPTGGTARFSNGVSVEDFVTKSSIIGYTRQALQDAVEDLSAIGGAEGLQAHVRSATVRLQAPPRSKRR